VDSRAGSRVDRLKDPPDLRAVPPVDRQEGRQVDPPACRAEAQADRQVDLPACRAEAPAERLAICRTNPIAPLAAFQAREVASSR
jgi:hypothetical protein